jgi:hypothetical protein
LLQGCRICVGFFHFFFHYYWSLQHRTHKTEKSTTQNALDTVTRKQTQITQIWHNPPYKQLEVKTNRSLFLLLIKGLKYLRTLNHKYRVYHISLVHVFI